VRIEPYWFRCFEEQTVSAFIAKLPEALQELGFELKSFSVRSVYLSSGVDKMRRKPLGREELLAWSGQVLAMSLNLAELMRVLRNRDHESTSLLGYAAAAHEELDNLLVELHKQPLMEDRPQVLPRRKQAEPPSLAVKKAV
jgi:hypothetical protein